ncbi:MAG: hypothetical protein C0410_01330 [Anaerolinea sp.]|nr:hypothetical protein [Anaerolinea sp.]
MNLGVKKDIVKNNILIYQGWELNFKKFFFYLKNKYGVSKQFLFIGRVKGNEKLYKSLNSIGYIIIFKPTIQNKDGEVKGNVDAELVLHTMIEYPNYDKAIIVSGDGDYHCLIEYLHQKDKLKHVLIPNKNQFSSLLREFSNYLIFINDIKQSLK